nr:type VI secretion system contractile sheath large subunit [Enterobacter hormaechei]
MNTDDARYIGLVMPRVLGRLPYGPDTRAGRPVTASGIKACRSHLPATWRTYCMAGVYAFCMSDKREGKS